MDFFNNILPGNYNLTKSMELVKIRTSGTLWYTKKFLVLYNIIFLTNKLETSKYIEEINQIFLNYIETLHESQKKNALKFFFNGEEKFSLKNTKTFLEFVDKVNFKDYKEKIQFESFAKKYYFAYLMGSGGQSGVKSEIKKYLFKKDFKFSVSKIEEIIKLYNKQNNKNHNITEIRNDYVAFIRNERQILYYFGYFHSKTAGAKDLEFSSLTPVGEIAYLANSKEFHIIWEHQKLKMISQPITVTINNLDNLKKDIEPENFSINSSPYFDILKYLKLMKKFSKDEYKYIISRNKENCNIFNLDLNYLKNNIDLVENKLKKYGRKSDLNLEDFNKELKKYLLGITSNMPLDKGENILGVLEEKREISISNDINFEKLYRMYKFLNDYKKNEYEDLFKDINKEMKAYYKSQVYGEENYKKNKIIKVNWNLYNGFLDNNIILGLIILMISLDKKTSILQENKKRILYSMKKEYPILIDNFLLNSNKLEETVTLFIEAYKKNIHISNLFIYEENDFEKNMVYYMNQSIADLKSKIKKESMNSTSEIGVRKRNLKLINLMKSYYIVTYDKIHNENKKKTELKCECCNERTFLTIKNLPYLEFHHIIPFGGKTKGQDHYLNLINLCPTCHAKIHRIQISERSRLYKLINKNNYLKKTLIERLYKLKEEKILKSYQLEYLYASEAITDEEYENIGEFNEA